MMGHPGWQWCLDPLMQQQHPQQYVDQMQQYKEQGAQAMCNGQL